MTCAAAELTFRGRGPPPVPRRISFVFALCAVTRRGSHAAAANAAAPVMNARRLCRGTLGRARVRIDWVILIEAPVFGGLGSAELPSKNVFRDTTILSEKGSRAYKARAPARTRCPRARTGMAARRGLGQCPHALDESAGLRLTTTCAPFP